MTEYYERENIMPGFVEGFGKVARDEHRHVAYGTWFLRRQPARIRSCRAHARQAIELLPVTAGVLVPLGPGLGGRLGAVGGYSATRSTSSPSLPDARLKAIGVPLIRPSPSAA